MNNQAWELSPSQPEKACKLSQKAYDLSRSGEFSSNPYQQGIAASLVTMSAIHRESGNMDIAATQCLEALAILNNLPPCDVTVDAWVTASWLHIYTGNYSKALEFGTKATNLARSLKTKLRLAISFDTLASIYSIVGELPEAVKLHREALRLFSKISNAKGEAICLNNLADTLMEMNELELAFRYGKKSLKIAQQQNLQKQEALATSTLSELLIKMGKFKLANKYLRGAIKQVEAQSPSILQTYLWSQLGVLAIKMNDLNNAEYHLLRALQSSWMIHALPEEARCHQFLAEVYEKQENFQKALEHYKDFFRINEKIQGEAASKRIETLRVVQQLEIAQKEAEIEHLRAKKLQKKIIKHKRAQKELEALATLDALTNLYNHRHI